MNEPAQRHHWRFLLQLDTGRRRWTLAALLLALLAAFSAVALVAAAGWLITASALAGIAASAGVAITLEIFAPGAAIRAFAVLRTVSRYGERLVGHEAIFRIMATLRRTLFARFAALPYQRLLSARRASVQVRLMSDVQTLENVHAGLLFPTAAATGATLLLALLAAWWASASFALLIIGLGILMLATCALTARLNRHRLLRQEARRDRSRRELLTLISSHKELYFADTRSRQMQRWLTREAHNNAALLRQRLGAAGGEALMQWLGAAALIAAVWLSAHLLLTDELLRNARVDGEAAGSTAAPVMALLIVGMLSLGGLWAGLANAWRQMPQTHAAVRRLLRDRPSPDRSVPSDSDAPSDTTTQPPEWVLDKVSLRRSVAGRPLLDQRDLVITAGSCLYITGPSGIGKSSIASLLCGLLPADSGTVLFAGQPVGTIPEAQRLARIAMMPQDTTLLSATLRDNLTLANPALDDDTLRAALNAVGLDYLTDALDQWIGLNGRPLSGGEARRVALIRCVLTPADALILDEPFRGLDTTSATQANDWLRQHQNNRTLIILDHTPRFPHHQTLNLTR
ncbi:ATP-binding cassette domain-containing protein [Alcanivorax sp. JB21]|uniref:amino acid ABC transporter ATP-binding/permease protein n=1 Tax=Alcanivorax limicola TaxID=2874102 RepID=UPI001CBC51E8|nr:ATP-binding cassette domain-containing protein [Alcanivorax limicola]MBZ2188114.1 ATP-binding cassette domain-containing protein [Alcanivorax limicola]